MAEKHHPASSRTARARTTRAMRRQEKIRVSEKHRQSRSAKQPDGFARGARVGSTVIAHYSKGEGPTCEECGWPKENHL